MTRRPRPLVGALALVTLLPGCLIERELYEARRAQLVDDDGDGVTEVQGDCDDTNAGVFAGAPEPCNGFDDDCDGAIDELEAGNDVVWAADADGDGYASDSASPYAACASPGDGWVSTWGDCDDTDAATFPGAEEACDGEDDDCDGAADEEPTVSPPTWHADEDGDGYGASDEGSTQCLPPNASGWVQDATDCDDGDALVNPGTTERCNGADDDCDDAVDDPPLAEAGGWFPDTDGDGYGDGSTSACVEAEGYVEVDGDCDDTDPDVNPAAEELCNDGKDNDCDGSPGECVWDSSIDMTEQLTISPVTEDAELGYAGLAADLDADGTTELVVSDPTASATAGEDMVGAVRVFGGPFSSDVSVDAADWTYWGPEDHCGAGASFVAEDIDADGFVDLLVGASNRTVGSVEGAGALYALFGPVVGGGHVEDDSDWTLVGNEAYNAVGHRAYALGDLDGNGLPDFGTAYEYIDHAGLDRTGAVYVFTAVGTGTEFAEDAATAIVYGSDQYDEIGISATGVDLDGDGLDDLVIGAQGYDSSTGDGAALVFNGPVSGTLEGDDADVILNGERESSYAGRILDAVGDTNGDGVDDLLVGSPQAGEGAAYLVWGDPSITSSPLADANVKFRADRADFHFGYSLQGLGDLNEDGSPDLFITEEQSDGGAWGHVFFGPFDTAGTKQASDADVILSGDSTDQVYTTAFTPGDATGDGVNDLVIGSYKHGTDYWDGIVYVVAGVGY